MKLTLPFPPSVNSLYSTDWKTKRRFKSKRYAEWCKLARDSLVITQAATYITKDGLAEYAAPVKVRYTFGRPDKRVRDLCNYIKGLEDFLVDNLWIADDSLIHEIHAIWGGTPGFVEIEILPLQNDSDCV